jgi:adsorption protein B
LRRFARADVQLFVGVYPNDAATRAAVIAVAATTDRITLVITPRPGPTCKADCLNALWRAAEQSRRPFAAYLLHDAEDVVSPHEPALISHLIDRFEMIQLPVLALPSNASRFVAGHYLDEFAESHGKDLMVREWIGAGLPSAGVGCAFRPDALRALAHAQGGLPFTTDSLTEDYDVALRLAALGARQALVRLPLAPGRAAVVATSEHFPEGFRAAVRQKARWLVGIALQGWDGLGWSGGWARRWMLLRDRKTLVTAVVAMLAYGVAALVLALMAWQALDPGAPRVPPLVEPGSTTAALLVLNGAFLLHRLLVRALFVSRLYGAREGLLSLPRAVVGNLITFVAAVRAMRLYGRRLLAWDKTVHRFPDPQQQPAE